MFDQPRERREKERSLQLSAPDLETLLVRWINELVLFSQDIGFVPVRADVRIRKVPKEGFFLQALLTGTPLDLEGYG